MRRSPASAIAAVVTLTVTLGACVSIFAVVDAVLAPPPFRDPDTLVVVGERRENDTTSVARTVPYGRFESWRERAQPLAGLEAFDGTNLTLTGVGRAARLSVNDVTPGFLTLLGIGPVLGRGFTTDDIGQRVVILSEAFWRETLAADPNAIGRSLILGDQPHTIIGVLPASFQFALNPADLWRTVPPLSTQEARARYRVGVLARLRPGATRPALVAGLDEISGRVSPAMQVVTRPVEDVISGGARGTVALLAGAAALAMLIAFINLAGLLTVRSIDRRRELAIRSALGATRRDVVKRLLLESQTLVAAGTAGGILLAHWLTPLAARLALEQFGGLADMEVSIRWPLIALVAIVAVMCGGVCAFIPGLMASRSNVVEILRGSTTPPRREHVLRRVFVTAEVTTAFVLLTCMMMLGASLLRLINANPGFDARGVLALQVSLPAAIYNAERQTTFYSSLHTTLEARLGRRSAAIVDEIPLTGYGRRALVSRTRATGDDDAGREAVVRSVSPGYFEVMRMSMLAGRSFERSDDASSPLRAVISETLARTLFASESPVGRPIRLAAGPQTAEVVGVVGDVTHRALDEATMPTVYLSAMQDPSASSIIVVRGARPDADVIAAVRGAVAGLDANLPVYGVRPLQDVVAGSPGVPARRVLTAAFTGFAVLALLLGAVGLFGIVAHEFAHRRRDIALRCALGANPLRLFGAVCGQGVVTIVIGSSAGALLSIWASRALSYAGFPMHGLDAMSVAVPSVILVLAGTVAVFPVALRATRIDPVITLRDL